MSALSHSGSGDGENALGRIVRRDVSKAARSSAILYLVSAVLTIVGTRVLSLVWGSSFQGLSESVLDIFVGAVAGYAGLVSLRTRSRPAGSIGFHMYALGLLGLSSGAIFNAFGGVGFLSIGYWMRQFHKNVGMRCGRDGGEIVVLGEDSLVCTKCSRLVRIGYNIPRKWSYAGLALLPGGIALYGLTFFAPVASVLTYPVNVAGLALLDGVVFLTTIILQRAYFEGYVRLPLGHGGPASGQIAPSQHSKATQNSMVRPPGFELPDRSG